MDALDFGNVFHETLEAFAREEAIRDSSDFREIEAFVLTELDAIFLNRFGRRLSLPLRVQQEGLRARLRQFARIQAPERRAGWRIRHGELRFEEEKTLHLAGLPIVGALDRVDVHEETGQRRILDYKTSAKRKSARSMHFDATSGAREMVQWRDLQLPLYRALAEFLWPGEPFRHSSDISCCPNGSRKVASTSSSSTKLYSPRRRPTPRWWPSGSVAGSFGLLARSSSTTLPVSFLEKIQRKPLAKNPKNS